MWEDIRIAFEHRASPRIPRGELWVGTEVLRHRFGRDDLGAHMELFKEMGMDFVSLPVSEEAGVSPMGYHIFSVKDVESAAKEILPVVAILDGPFQQRVNRTGLRQTLMDIGRDDAQNPKIFESEASQIQTLAEQCVIAGAKAIITADDLAYDKDLLFSPEFFRQAIYPLYTRLAESIHRRNAYAVLHSDGNISKLIPDIIRAGFDGLSCQSECLDIFGIKETFGNQLSLLTGIPGVLLDGGLPTDEARHHFIGEIRRLNDQGGFILSSTCGVSTVEMLDHLRTLYDWADTAVIGGEHNRCYQ